MSTRNKPVHLIATGDYLATGKPFPESTFDISIQTGDFLRTLDQPDHRMDEWMKGKNERNTTVGWFPSSLVKVISRESYEKQKKQQNRTLREKGLSSYPWYVPSLSREECEAKLKAGDLGDFLVRNSSTAKNCYALSFKDKTGVVHLLIEHTDEGFKLSKTVDTYPSIINLLMKVKNLNHRKIRRTPPSFSPEPLENFAQGAVSKNWTAIGGSVPPDIDKNWPELPSQLVFTAAEPKLEELMKNPNNAIGKQINSFINAINKGFADLSPDPDLQWKFAFAGIHTCYEEILNLMSKIEQFNSPEGVQMFTRVTDKITTPSLLPVLSEISAKRIAVENQNFTEILGELSNISISVWPLPQDFRNNEKLLTPGINELVELPKHDTYNGQLQCLGTAATLMAKSAPLLPDQLVVAFIFAMSRTLSHKISWIFFKNLLVEVIPPHTKPLKEGFTLSVLISAINLAEKLLSELRINHSTKLGEHLGFSASELEGLKIPSESYRASLRRKNSTAKSKQEKKSEDAYADEDNSEAVYVRSIAAQIRVALPPSKFTVQGKEIQGYEGRTITDWIQDKRSIGSERAVEILTKMVSFNVIHLADRKADPEAYFPNSVYHFPSRDEDVLDDLAMKRVSITTEKSESAYSELNSRIISFNGWPHTSPTAEQMAKAGFFFEPSNQWKDRVECWKCRTVVSNWIRSDEPLVRHWEASPKCPFVETFLPKEMVGLEEHLNPADPTKKYKLNKRIGKGSFGEVWSANVLEPKKKDLVAIKKMHVTKMALYGKFQSGEVINHKKASGHPNIVPLYDSHLFDNYLWMAMEYMAWGSFARITINASLYGKSFLDKKHRMTEPVIAYVLLNLLKGLDYLHGKNLLHRDIKADNLLLNDKGELKIADFGFICELKGDQKSRDIVGTPFWMAPELIMSFPYAFEVDIWSTGITLVECLEGEPPYMKQGDEQAKKLICNCKHVPLKLPHLVSKDCSDLLAKLCDVNRETRITANQALEHPFLKQAVKVSKFKEATKYILTHLPSSKGRKN